VNTSGFLTESAIAGDSPEDTLYLKRMSAEARRYISSFPWCPPIKELMLARGVGRIVAAFLIQFAERIQNRDEFLWVIVGDLPSAYFVIDHCRTPAQAIQTYCDLMQRWADAVVEHKDLFGIYPVAAQPTADNALLLQKRIQYLRERIGPLFRT
jgi:hypothetical protein